MQKQKSYRVKIISLKKCWILIISYTSVQAHCCSVVFHVIVVVYASFRSIDILIGSDSPINYENFAFVRSTSNFRLQRILLETEFISRHEPASLWSDYLHSIIGLPSDLLFVASFAFLECN